MMRQQLQMGGWRGMIAFAVVLALRPTSAQAYITNPVQTLGHLCESTYITVVRVEKVSKEKGIIIYRKVQDLKGNYPQETIRHVFDLKNTPQHEGQGDVPIRPDEKDWRYAIQWAEVGKTAVIFSLKYDPFGDFGHTYIDHCWYATMCPKRDWDLWYSIYAQPALLGRWHCGSTAYLVTAIEEILAGKNAVVPVMSVGTRDDLRAGSAKIAGLQVSLRLKDHNANRDKAPWPIGPNSPLPADTIEKWKAAGADIGWLRVNRLGDATFFDEPSKKAGDLPAFRIRPGKSLPATKLTDPNSSFALDLRDTTITDTDLKTLANLTNLKALNLANTQVTDPAVAALRKALPACAILGRDSPGTPAKSQ